MHYITVVSSLYQLHPVCTAFGRHEPPCPGPSSYAACGARAASRAKGAGAGSRLQSARRWPSTSGRA